ncbi:MAG: formate--tetrahydrofolate ligase [Bryobacterales bacterium]|nr:formate--tetrahydrofolate ligase [Bryobacterales bacterium]
MPNPLIPVQEIAERAGIPEHYLDYYGKYTAKVRLDFLEPQPAARGKFILVTAITPTNHGEGKTVVSIGLAQALRAAGHRAIATLREPSLGPVFGTKGGATGGGLSKVEPSDIINLHFNGDFHAVTSAHNLLAAMIDSHFHHGNALGLDVDNIFWTRTLDMNDRSLRHVVVGLGGKVNGVPRETGFVITAASEIMAILALASSRADLRKRLGDIVIGFGLDGRTVHARDLGATGAMMVLLNEAIMPNLVQTTDGTPALVHAGPFANIAHGTSSVIAQRMALQSAEYVVNETGFAADLGAEKYFDIVMPSSGLKPDAAVLIASVRAVIGQGGSHDNALQAGLVNLQKHIENLKQFNVPVVVALNRFKTDTEEQLDTLARFCASHQVPCALTDVFERGAEGGRELAAAVVEAAAKPSHATSLYPAEVSLDKKVSIVARQIYGAVNVHFESKAKKQLQKFASLGFDHLPVCMAKTQSSLTDNPKLLGAPTNWTLTVSDAYLSAGAGFIVVIAGNMLLMPGLGKDPAALHLDVDEEGNIIGL